MAASSWGTNRCGKAARMEVGFVQDGKKGKAKVKTRTGDGFREQRVSCLHGAISARQFFVDMVVLSQLCHPGTSICL